VPDGGYPLGGAHETDPFSTGLAIETLSCCPPARRARSASGPSVRCSPQLGDGGWSGDYQLRIPPLTAATLRGMSRGGRAEAAVGQLVLDRGGFSAAKRVQRL
jgi:hypothetical protein